MVTDSSTHLVGSRCGALLVIAISLTLVSGVSSSTANGNSGSKVYAKAVSSVTLVQARVSDTDTYRFGSAFAFGSPGSYLTNAHVVGNAKVMDMKTSDGRIAKATVVQIDPKRDVALLQSDLKLPVLFAASKTVLTGEDAYAIGAPRGQEFTLTVGVVSKADRQFDRQSWIQTDASLNPGNSGGPLLNDHADVVGVNTEVLVDPTTRQQAQGIGYAIPIAEATDALGLPRGDRTSGATNRKGSLTTDGQQSGKGDTNALPVLTGVSVLLLLTIGGGILMQRRAGGLPKRARRSQGSSSRQTDDDPKSAGDPDTGLPPKDIW